VVLLLAGCTKHGFVDLVMGGAYRPDPTAEVTVEGWELLGGDLHCHVSPPDRAGHVGRGLADTVELAEAEGLDFVVLTPHVWDEVLASSWRRAELLRDHAALERVVAALDTDVAFVVGLEYSTRSGHASMAFADLEAVLGEVTADAARSDPAAFVEAYVARGGFVVVNHPLLTPIDSPFVRNAGWDLSWRPWTQRASRHRPDVAAIHRLAHAWEIENSAVSHLRDYHYLGNPGSTRRSVLHFLDRRVPAEQRRMTPVGGSDSHSQHLRAVTWVLAQERSVRGIRDALRAGRTCVRSPWACTFEARLGGGSMVGPGGRLALEGDTPLEVRVGGDDATVWLDGVAVARPARGEIAALVPPDRCAVLRATIDGGESAPIYVGCGF
jgi:hypothetical protein